MTDTPLTKARIEEIEAREKAATPDYKNEAFLLVERWVETETLDRPLKKMVAEALSAAHAAGREDRRALLSDRRALLAEAVGIMRGLMHCDLHAESHARRFIEEHG